MFYDPITCCLLFIQEIRFTLKGKKKKGYGIAKP